jgi:hypothetical protein
MEAISPQMLYRAPVLEDHPVLQQGQSLKNADEIQLWRNLQN